jgi:hypothetical protein
MASGLKTIGQATWRQRRGSMESGFMLRASDAHNLLKSMECPPVYFHRRLTHFFIII